MIESSRDELPSKDCAIFYFFLPASGAAKQLFAVLAVADGGVPGQLSFCATSKDGQRHRRTMCLAESGTSFLLPVVSRRRKIRRQVESLEIEIESGDVW